MSWGFVMIGSISFTLAYTLSYLADHEWLNFCITCGLIFSTNWGCNIATYCLPVDAFPAEVRSSFYGLSAAAGKIGAFAGGYLFTAISDAYGYGVVYMVCGILSALGVLLAHGFIEPFGANTFCVGGARRGAGGEEEDGGGIKSVV
jgi:predicted MFS family arabinose efflux permease